MKPWMRGFLLLAAAYNVAWSAFMHYFDTAFIKWITAGAQVENGLVQWLSLGVFLLGGLFFAAALYPYKVKWGILIGFIAKLFGGAWVWHYIMQGAYTKKFLFHLIMNDWIWVIPLAVITFAAFKRKPQPDTDDQEKA